MKERRLWISAPEGLGEVLELVYEKYNHRSFIHPDPLEFLYRYDESGDREIVGLVASALAYGRVKQILASVGRVLNVLGASPGRYLLETAPDELYTRLASFRHRFTSGTDLAALLVGVGRVVRRHGSLEECFMSGMDGGTTVMNALERFCNELRMAAGRRLSFLLPTPSGKSACKRLNLFLRWMVRRDEVDPGVWHDVPRAKLIVPLDVHMHGIARDLGFTHRKRADMRAALEVTAAFRRFVPEDPARYDFALTRFGIREELEPFSRVFTDLMEASVG